METRPNYKQLISYVIVKNAKGEILVLQRLTGGKPTAWTQNSIGVGGHMNPVDGLSGDNCNTYRTRRNGADHFSGVGWYCQ